MKVIVFGAAGATGQLIIDEALARGHQVTAFVRTPSKLTKTHERLTVVAGDAMDSANVEKALAGHDVVVDAIGSGDMKPSTVRTDTAKVIVDAMARAGVSRIVAMSGLGAGESVKAIPLPVRMILVPLLLKHLLKDQNGLENHVTNSALAWTIVRPGQLNDVPKSGKTKTSLDGKGLSMGGIPRGDVAVFIVDEMEKGAFVRKAPSLGV